MIEKERRAGGPREFSGNVKEGDADSNDGCLLSPLGKWIAAQTELRVERKSSLLCGGANDEEANDEGVVNGRRVELSL